MERKLLKTSFSKTMEASPHTPVYTMHKYFARRPWNVFRELISHYTAPEEIVLDPFCGGGVTVVESLKLRRRAIGIDINPIATYVTSMEVRPLDVDLFRQAFSAVSKKVKQQISSLYSTKCIKCGSSAHADWIEWNESTKQITRLKYDCSVCGYSGEKSPNSEDIDLSRKIDDTFMSTVEKQGLWFPRTPIPPGDKTGSLLSEGINYFYELFTRRNLLALSMLYKEIANVENEDAREFLRFAFSGSLKWASRQSHLRGQIIEGWAMHAYWIYPKSLEINVWNTFERRVSAIVRGKKYSNRLIGQFCRFGQSFTDIENSKASCLVLTRSSTSLPFPDGSVDAVVTDPPYGGNVNYGELADFWFIWLSEGLTIDKKDEVIINKTQNKTIEDYELMLCRVLKECYRVLKPHKCLVSTFNSKDLRVVASFVMGASRAGFVLHPDRLLYQTPIRAYTTTFHAMQIGAFVGDFVFTFVKEDQMPPDDFVAHDAFADLRQSVANLLDENVRGEITEPQLREQAYKALIPFLCKYSRVDVSKCREAVDFFELEMRKHEDYFKKTRKKIVETRRRKYLPVKDGSAKTSRSSGQASIE